MKTLSRRVLRLPLLAAGWLALCPGAARAAEWQWSVPDGERRGNQIVRDENTNVVDPSGEPRHQIGWRTPHKSKFATVCADYRLLPASVLPYFTKFRQQHSE